VCLRNKQTKPNQTQSKQTKHHLFCLFVQTVYQNQTKPNLLNNKFNIKCLKSKVPEKLARAAQLLYRSVLVYIKNICFSQQLGSGTFIISNLCRICERQYWKKKIFTVGCFSVFCWVYNPCYKPSNLNGPSQNASRVSFGVTGLFV